MKSVCLDEVMLGSNKWVSLMFLRIGQTSLTLSSSSSSSDTPWLESPHVTSPVRHPSSTLVPIADDWLHRKPPAHMLGLLDNIKRSSEQKLRMSVKAGHASPLHPGTHVDELYEAKSIINMFILSKPCPTFQIYTIVSSLRGWRRRPRVCLWSKTRIKKFQQWIKWQHTNRSAGGSRLIPISPIYSVHVNKHASDLHQSTEDKGPRVIDIQELAGDWFKG